MANLLDSCVIHALASARIVGKRTASYANDNPVESKMVFAYLRGDKRRPNVNTEIGAMLVALEDARRAGYGPAVVPPPLPPDDNQEAYTAGPYGSEVYSK
jgi:hypothetical protein